MHCIAKHATSLGLSCVCMCVCVCVCVCVHYFNCLYFNMFCKPLLPIRLNQTFMSMIIPAMWGKD